MSPKSSSRLAFKFWLLLFKGRLPHGLISWRYLLPDGGGKTLSQHLAIWWIQAGTADQRGLPRWVWLGAELLLWLRWVLLGAWLATWRTVRARGDEVRASEDLAVWRQALRTLRLALGYVISPRDVYRHGLYRWRGALAVEQALDYVFAQETHGFHAWRNQHPDADAAIRLLSDKFACAQRLSHLGVPMVETFVLAERGETERRLLTIADRHGRVFCKPRSGSGGHGAFSAWLDAGELRGRTLRGDLLQSDEVIQAWRRLAAQGEVLLQTCLTDHPRLVALHAREEVTTVRLMTVRRQDQFVVAGAFIEIPGDGKAYDILPLALASGLLQTWPASSPISSKQRERHQRLLEQGAVDVMEPVWRELRAQSLLAHAVLPGLHAVAWDWVMTPSGPRLLEGNSGFGLAPLQRLRGGCLAADSALASESQ